MKNIILILCLILFSGCVRSTAQWVVDKTAPNPTTEIVDTNTSDGIIFNDTSEDSWTILLTIGGLIFLICVIVPILSRLDWSRIKNYFRKKDT